MKVNILSRIYNSIDITYLCGYIMFLYLFVASTYYLFITLSGNLDIKVGDVVTISQKYHHKIIIKTDNDIFWYNIYQILLNWLIIIVSVYMGFSLYYLHKY